MFQQITTEACLTVRIIENGGVMVNVLASRSAGRRFQSRSSQTNGYKIGICCFSTKHTALKIKDNDRLARNHDNLSEWSGATCLPHGLLFQ